MIKQILSTTLFQNKNLNCKKSYEIFDKNFKYRILQNTFATSKINDLGSEHMKLNETDLYISEACKRKLKEICDSEYFLRLTVEGGGCSGFTYKFEIDKELKEDDKIFGSSTERVVVDSISLEYCAGATIDYHSELIKTGFKVVSNPKAEAGCSCGSSFAVRLD
ncbi:iron-sulfur cluster assembly 2 homolog, mitochondrial [Condylostylus longicornis]|uniref:iron-sulfur cluster assembly 2 homolog, mitochondrial n=1 Tax=Condylostylus longicornis TaxID=2530218 RepID=UPI00244DB101|nr:iron-sulfur cluster assembly 2 homolog, mitochondrial [Condylostylus longicornis]